MFRTIRTIRIIRLIPAICALIFLFGSAQIAHAGLIFKAPASIGLISGLVGYWSFDGPDVSGNTVYDRSNSYATGTFANASPVRVPGKTGQALNLKYPAAIDIANTNSGIRINGDMTISAWVKQRTGIIDSETIFGQDVGQVNLNYSLEIDNGNGGLQFRHGDGANVDIYESGIHISDGNWHHVTFVADFPSGHFYIDGKKVNTVTMLDDIAFLSANNYMISVVNTCCPTANLDGSVDDVRIYNRALNENEIRRLYKMGGTLRINQPKYTGTLNDGLVGYWSFDGPDMAGTTTYDRSGRGNTGIMGVLTSPPPRVIGKIGQALSFNPITGNDVGITDSSSIQNLGPLTYSAWIKANSIGENTSGTIISKEGYNQGPVFGFQNTPSAAFGFTRSCVTDNQFLVRGISQSNVPFGVWHHVIATWDGSTSITGIHVYVNGVEYPYTSTQACGGGIKSDAGRTMTIGNGSNSGAWDGYIDEVRVYNRVLTEGEILRLYKIGGTLKINQSVNTGSLKDGLVGYWSFDGPDMAGFPSTQTSAGTIYDRSGNNNNGSLWSATGTQPVIGKIGQGFKFDGVDDFARIPAASSINSLTKMTVGLWLKSATSTYRSLDGLIAKGGAFDGTGPGWVLTPRHKVAGGGSCSDEMNYGVMFGVNAGNFGSYALRCSGNNIFELNEWIHLLATWDGTEGTNGIHIYKNGKEVSYSTPVCCSGDSSAPNDSSVDLYIGRRGTDTSGLFKGVIDDVRIYNRVLTPEEIQRLYNMGK